MKRPTNLIMGLNQDEGNFWNIYYIQEMSTNWNNALPPSLDESVFDATLNKAFTHTTGKDTTVEITLADKATIKPKLRYYITVFVLDGAGKRTHIGEKDGKAGLCNVLTDGNPNKVTMIARPVR